jgi:hypothetical protein
MSCFLDKDEEGVRARELSPLITPGVWLSVMPGLRSRDLFFLSIGV